MYNLLNRSWQEIVNSDDVVIRTMMPTKQIVIDGEEVDGVSKHSSIIVQYDYVTGKPIILVERIRVDKLTSLNLDDINNTLPRGFIAHVNENDDNDCQEDGYFVDIVVERRDLFEVLSKSANNTP